MDKEGMNRREFLKGTAWLGAAAVAAGCHLNRFGFGEGGLMQNFAYRKLMGRKIRVGFVGIGGRGTAAVHRVAMIPGLEVVALCDKNPERIKVNLDWFREQKHAGIDRIKAYVGEDEDWKTPEAVIAGLVGCVSRSGNLLLNVGPTELGEIPEGSVKILKALADWQGVHGESVTGCGKSEFTPPYGCVYTQKGDTLYCHFLQSPLGDTILPQLKGRIREATLLRTGEDVEQVNNWGFELLRPDEQRIRTRAIRPGDVVRIELKNL